MKTIFPKKLKTGDEIRILSLSDSLACLPKSICRLAEKRLAKLSYKVTYGKNSFKKDALGSLSVADRLQDFTEAIADKNVALILAADGGYNVNQLLPELDYDLIRKNPKIICGYSDITALTNAIYAKIGVITYNGPLFQSFGMLKGFDYTENCFQKAIQGEKPVKLVPAEFWSDDKWKTNQNRRLFIKNNGYAVLNPGQAEGNIIGGNLCTLNLLQGTKYMPSLADKILFIEDDDLVTEYFAQEFERNLVSLLQQPGAEKIKALVLGRFQKRCRLSLPLLKKIISTKKILKSIPVIANVDFGHTSPQITFAIGGRAKIAANTKVDITFLKY